MSVCMIKEHSRLNPDDMCFGLVLLLLLTISAHAQQGYSSRPVCLSVCHALILEITDN